MKKSLIACISALAFPAGGAFAQNIADLPSFVSPGNTAQIEQIGSSNGAGLDQKVESASSGNYADIYQGHDDSGTVYTSWGSTAGVSQTASGGALNSSRTIQFGTSQTSSISQNNTGAGQYFAVVMQGTKNYDLGFFTGSAGNHATIQQQVTADGVSYYAFQPGSLMDFLTHPDTVVSAAVITQLGQNSTASITQESPGSIAAIDQRQTGSGNYATVSQTGGASNRSDTQQWGNNGSVTVQQSGVLGMTNGTSVLQNSSNSIVSVDQHGALGQNWSEVTQNAGLGHDEAHVIQDGQSAYANSVSITQQDGAYAYVDQQSIYAANTATVSQAGPGNIVNVRQR